MGESPLPPVTGCVLSRSCEIKVPCGCSAFTQVVSSSHLVHLLKYTVLSGSPVVAVRITVVGLSALSHHFTRSQVKLRWIVTNSTYSET